MATVPVIPGLPIEVASTRVARRRGLLGRGRIEGVLVIVPCRQVHTFGMRFPIDVAFVSRRGRVLRVLTMGPGRVSRPVVRSRWVLEGPAGSFGRRSVRRGTTLDLREHADRES